VILCGLILVACNSDNSYSVAGDTVSEPTHFMAKFMLIINNSMGGGAGSFGWTVVVFTIVLRLILSPLDIWQKIIGRKNSKAMERMKPQLEALQAKYGDDKQRMQQEQMALYKKEHYSMMGMCLPTIITLVVFFVVFAGFRQMVGYQFAQDYKNSQMVYEKSLSAQIEEKYSDANGDGKIDLDDIVKDEEGAAFYAKAVEAAQDAVYVAYYSSEQQGVRSWLWIKNIFVGDNWSKAVPDFTTVTGQSGFANSRLAGITIDEYNSVMGKVIGTGGYGKGGSWNGLLILPVLSIALSFLSQKLMSKSQGQPPMPAADKNGGAANASQQSMKMMQWLMPVMMGVFGLLYSGAFALYMFTSSLTAILFQLLFNVCGKLADNIRDNKSNPRIAKR
ncbi:MAG: YidC/Oxa1 family membrane protein insertase, partial [Clostridia bacterium]|nr:YidC/Oxa1 family membrane protein insertase [Clostridia bacterium]